MPMEVVLLETLKATPALAVLLYVAIQNRRDKLASEERYHAFVTSMFEAFQTSTKEMIAALTRGNDLIDRVGRKLDEKH